MANIENIVKIMNFHSMIRIEKSKSHAERFFQVEDQLTRMTRTILYNKNLNLDKKILKANPKGIDLKIYIGNDLGFCGDFNATVSKYAKQESNAKKVIIGKKIMVEDPNVILKMSKEEFYNDSTPLEQIIYQYIEEEKIKSITVIYNRYHHVNDIRFEEKTIFPIEIQSQEDINLDIDFVIETNVKEVLNNLIALYLCYEIKILETNSWASENVMREKVTRESIKKIEDLNEEKRKEIRKEKKQVSFQKQISNYRMGSDEFDRENNIHF